MAGPNLPGENKKNAIEEERDQGVDLRRNEKPDPAVSVGLTAEEIGMSAKTTNSLQDATKLKHDNSTPSGQEVKEELDSTSHIYASGLDGDAAIQQYNDAMSGAADGRIAGTIFENIEIEKKRIEENRRNNVARDIASLYNIATIQGFEAALTETKNDLNEVKAEAHNEREYVNEIVARYEERIEELQERIDGNADEFAALREKSASGQELTEDEALQLRRFEAEINLRDALREECHNLVRDMNGIIDNVEQTEARIAQIEAEIAEVKRNGGQPSEALQQRLIDANGELATHRDALHSAHARHETSAQVESSLEAFFEQAQAAPTAARQFTHEENLAQVEFMEYVAQAQVDGSFDMVELQKMDELLTATGVDEVNKEAADAFKSGGIAAMAGTGIGIKRPDGEIVYGEEATAFLTQMYEAAKDAVSDVGEAISDGYDNVKNMIFGREAEAQEQGQIVYERATFLNEKMTTGTEQERDEARIGAAILGSNQSMLPEVITDSQGREVYKDYESGNDRSYYYMDESGEKQFYDPNSAEVDSFEQFQSAARDPNVLASSSDAMFSTSEFSTPDSGLFSPVSQTPISGLPTPEANQFGMNDRGQPMIFKNNAGDMSTYQAKWERMQAQEAKSEIQGEISGLYDKIDELNALSAINGAQAQELNDLQQQFDSGKIDEQQLADRLTALTEEAQKNQLEVAATTDSVQTDSDNAWTEDQHLTLEADEEHIEFSPAVINQIENSTITREGLDQALSGSSPEVRAKIEDELKRTGIEIKEPENEPVASMAPTSDNANTLTNNAMTFTPIPGSNISAPVQSIDTSTPSFDSNGVYAAGMAAIGSFADSLFGLEGEPTPSYAAGPINNGTANLNVSPSNEFGQTPNQDAPSPSSSSGAPSLAEQQRLQQDALEQRMQELEAARLAQGGGMSGGGV